VRLRYHCRDWLPHGLREYQDGRGIVARVRLRTEWPQYPCRRDGLVIYPVGRFTTTLCGPEFAAAFEAREIEEVYEWSSYDVAPALRDYAECVLSLRRKFKEEGNLALAGWAKALGVALVGKFAQDARSWEEVEYLEPHPDWGNWRYKNRAGQIVPYRSIAG